MLTRGLIRCALGAALVAACAFAPAAQAAKSIKIEGFRAAAPKNGAAIPKAVAKPGGRLRTCQRRDAIMVIFAYAGMNDRRDRIKVNWYRNGKKYYFGKAIAPDGSDGRAFRSLSPGVRNGRFRADIVLNGKVVKRGTVRKACPRR
jgi:hypothetical protein